jgi:hypothetical protein
VAVRAQVDSSGVPAIGERQMPKLRHLLLAHIGLLSLTPVANASGDMLSGSVYQSFSNGWQVAP